MSGEDRVLGWEDEISNDSLGPSTIFAPGEYQYEIVNVVRGRHTPKETGKLPECPKAEVTVRVYAKDGSEYIDLKENLFLHSRCEGMLCQFFRSIGHRKHGEPLVMDWKKVVGCRGRCKVSLREYTMDGEKRQANDIKAFLDPKMVPAAAPDAGF
jgi:hypothetical protein